MAECQPGGDEAEGRMTPVINYPSIDRINQHIGLLFRLADAYGKGIHAYPQRPKRNVRPSTTRARTRGSGGLVY